jgi:hypothetical protein
MANLRLVLMALGLFGLSALVGASIYDGVVLAPNLGGGPAGLEHGRLFMSRANPGTLFRVLSPATQLLLLAALIAAWRLQQCRWLLLGALVAILLADVITFTFHYPRNHLLLGSPLTTDPAVLATAAREWARGNLVRIALVIAAWLSTLLAFGRAFALLKSG